MTTLYYDPQLDVHHRLPVSWAMTTSYYTAPQVPADARRLFDAASAAMDIDGGAPFPLRAGRGFASALILSREWGLAERERQLVESIESSWEPTWDAATGEFTWGMGLNEPHPRGQFNAFLAAAEATGPGMWTRLSAAPLDPCPQIVGVDFPKMALRRAEWVDDCLHLGLAPLHQDPKVFTTFRLVGAEPRLWELSGIDGATMDVTGSGMNIRVPMVHADITFTPSSY